jgi:hypothetical protein
MNYRCMNRLFSLNCYERCCWTNQHVRYTGTSAVWSYIFLHSCHVYTRIYQRLELLQELTAPSQQKAIWLTALVGFDWRSALEKNFINIKKNRDEHSDLGNYLRSGIRRQIWQHALGTAAFVVLEFVSSRFEKRGDKTQPQSYLLKARTFRTIYIVQTRIPSLNKPAAKFEYRRICCPTEQTRRTRLLG